MTKRQAYMKAYHAKHKERERDARRVRYATNPEKYAAAQRKNYYGVAPEQGTKLWDEQGRVCAICRAGTPGGRGTWHLDHDHDTGKIRGFLCQGCNIGLGFFRDDALRLDLAASYLRKHKC